MAPTQETSQECGTGNNFFASVSRDNYPPARAKAQPWKNICSVNESTKASQSDGKMVVACGLRHDYGKSVTSTVPAWQLIAQVHPAWEAHNTRILLLEIKRTSA
jgi:hypothetical protein